MYDFDNLISTASPRTYEVPAVGTVTVEIGNGTMVNESDRTDHAYRVTVNGTVIDQGTHFGVPAGDSADSEASALTLLQLVADEGLRVGAETFNAQALDNWAYDRRDGIQS